ncbi:MAG: hypothetical protein QOI31_1865 [Solirubrobacterales bacterium]|jgi:hypothetical protein|nr:hypothetical protein [Solirubrobacterales bacterium]
MRYARPAVARLAREYDAARIARSIAASALLVVMVLGSVAMWTVIPIAGLWVASQLSDSSAYVGIVPLLVAVGGIPAAMVVAGKLLVRVERLHMRVTGTAASDPRVAPAWRRSLGDSGHSPRMTVLDRLMVASALLAAIVMAVWFFASAGSSLPT